MRTDDELNLGPDICIHTLLTIRIDAFPVAFLYTMCSRTARGVVSLWTACNEFLSEVIHPLKGIVGGENEDCH